jgi:hypothetical protein
VIPHPALLLLHHRVTQTHDATNDGTNSRSGRDRSFLRAPILGSINPQPCIEWLEGRKAQFSEMESETRRQLAKWLRLFKKWLRLFKESGSGSSSGKETIVRDQDYSGGDRHSVASDGLPAVLALDVTLLWRSA